MHTTVHIGSMSLNISNLPRSMYSIRDSGFHTMSFGDSGALSASASSCAFSLTLPDLVLMVRKASPILFWLPFTPGPALEEERLTPGAAGRQRSCVDEVDALPLA